MMWRLWMVLGLLAPSVAFAGVSDMDYVVSGGFTTYVNAFTRLKYIFSDSEYSAMVVSMVVLSVPICMLAMVGRATVQGMSSGKPALNFGWLAMWLLGSLIYRGVMLPTSTIHIYDQDRNLYQPVAGVPSVMVMAAGVTNKFTQMFRDVITRNSASTTRTFGEGTPIKMLSALVTGTGAPFDPYLRRNITEFWHSCADIASQTNSTTFDRAKLLTGSNRLLADLAPLANPAVYSEWYSATSPYNSTVTCTDAYNKIKTAMAVTGAAGTGPFGERIKSVCEKTGYSSTNASQLADCATQMENAVKDIFGDSGLTLTVASQNIMLAQSINDSLLQDNPNAAMKQLVNRSMVNAGIADATGSPEWISEIKAGVVAVVLAMMPILAMLIVTPLLAKVLPLVLGLWVWIAAWDVADMMLLQAANDQIYTVMDELRRSKMGLDMLTLAPTASMKALSVVAASREHAMQIATFIAGLFGISAYSMQSLGSRVTANLDKANDKAGDQALTMEGKGDLLAGATRGVAESTVHGQIHNIESMANPQAMGAIREAASTAAKSSAFGGIPQAGQQLGSMDAAQEVGHNRGMGTPTTAMATASIGAEQQVGSSAGVADAATAHGQSVAAMSQTNTAVSTAAETGSSAARLASGGSLGGVTRQADELTTDQTDTALGSARGRTRAAQELGMSKQEVAAVQSTDQTVMGVGGVRGRDQAAQDLGVSKSHMAQTTSFADTASRTVESNRQIEAAGNTAGGWVGVNTVEHAASDANLQQFGQNPEQATEHQKQLLAERVAQADGRQEIYQGQGGLDRTNHAQGVADAAHNSGVADALEQAPDAAQGMVAASSNNTAEQIGRGNGLGKQAVPEGTRTGGIHAQEAMANNHVYGMLNAAGLSDRDIAQAKANNHVPLSLNPDQASVLHSSGLLNDQQYKAIKDNGSGSMVLDLAQDKQGHVLATTQVSAGDSTSINNSWTQDDSKTVNKDDRVTQDVTRSSKAFTGDTDSDRRTLSDKEHLLSLIQTRGLDETGKDYASAGSQVLATVMQERVDRSQIATAGGSASVSGGNEAGWFGASAQVGLQAQSVDQSTVNTQRAKMQTAWDNIVSEGRGKHQLTGDNLDRFVASKAADTFDRAFVASDSYANKHQGSDSPLDPLADPVQPESPAALGKGASEHYGPGATLKHVHNPAKDPEYKAATQNALAYSQEGGQTDTAKPATQDSPTGNPPVMAPIPATAGMGTPDRAEHPALDAGRSAQAVTIVSQEKNHAVTDKQGPLPEATMPSSPTDAVERHGATSYVDSALESGRFPQEARGELAENFAHAQNALMSEAEARGLSQNWVNANMRQYTETVMTAPKGAENQAGEGMLKEAGVNLGDGSMPPIPSGVVTSNSGQMPPINYQKYKDGVDGY